jgi:hypothetical protein
MFIMEKFLFVMSKGFEKAGGATLAMEFAVVLTNQSVA